MQLRQLHLEIGQCLAQADIEDPRREAALILAHFLNLQLSEIYTRSSMELSEAKIGEIRQAAERRAKREPLAYLVGRVCFMDLEFEVGPGALVPRPDSEILVETAIQVGQAMAVSQLDILDVCTGTGCIGISLAVHLRRENRLRHLWLTDIDREAAAFADGNLKIHHLDEQATLEITDLFPIDSQQHWDLIVANPPYIASGVIAELMPEVSVYEPRLALDGGSDGLDFYRRLIALAADRLNPGGALLLEHGYDQAEEIKSLFSADLRYRLIPTIIDYGGQPRVTGGYYANSI